jgi:hypothetical protein
MNKTLGKTRTQLIRTVREKLNIKAEEVRDRLTLVKASPSHLVATIRVKRKAIPLTKYAPRQTRTGVSVSIWKSKGRQTLAGAFMARMPTGHVGVYLRKPDWRHKLVGIEEGRKIYHGLPIRELFGPAVVAVVSSDPEILKKLGEFASDDLVQQLASQTTRFQALAGE